MKSALDQVGMATTVTGPLLHTVLGTVAGVIILGAGGGLIEPVQGRWESMLNRAESESAQVRAQTSSASTSDAYPDEAAGSSTRTATYGTSTRG